MSERRRLDPSQRAVSRRATPSASGPDTAVVRHQDGKPRPLPDNGNALSPQVLTDLAPGSVDNPDVYRLLSWWETARDGAAIPHRAAIDPFALRWCLGHLMVVEQTADDDFVYRLYGSLIVQATKFDMTGRRVSEFGSDAGRFFADTYRRCLEGPAPLYTQHQSIHASPVYRWERLLLPFDDGSGAARIVLVYNRTLSFDAEPALY